MKRLSAARPWLAAYVIVVGFTVGLLVNRLPLGRQAITTSGGAESVQQHGVERDAPPEPPLWQQLFRPSPPTARWMLRLGIPMLAVADGSAAEEEQQELIVLSVTGHTGEKPDTLFQTVLPFLRTNHAAGGKEPVDSPPQQEPVQQPPVVEKPPAAPPKQTEDPKQAKPAVVNGGLPVVGIYHTHDGESYLSEFPTLALRTAKDLDLIRSDDHKKRTIMGVGQTLAQQLEQLGVTTVYAKYTHQALGYNYAYRMSRDTARRILKEHPSVKILLDVHRDGAWGLDTTALIDGKKVAKVRCIIGNESQPRWQQNMQFCDRVMEELEQQAPGITFPTKVQPDTYNQDLTPGAILLEIGGATNQYAEAERAVAYLAKALNQIIRDGAYPR